MAGSRSILYKIQIVMLSLCLFLTSFAVASAQSTIKVAMVVYSDKQSLSSLVSDLKVDLENRLSAVNNFELLDVYSRLKKKGTQFELEDRWDKAADMLTKGKNAYDLLELDKAVVFLGKAERFIFSSMDSPFRMDVFSQTMVYLAASNFFLGKKNKSLKVFQRLLAINPEARLDPMLFPPSLFSIFKKAAKDLKKKPTGKILLDSDPSGAKVWLDGQAMGLTPKKFSDLLPGSHLIRLTHSGYRDVGKLVDVSAGSVKKVVASLDMLMGTAWLNSLLQRLNAGIDRSVYPDEVDQLLRKVDADRFVFVSVSTQGDEIRICAFHWDGVSGRRLRALESVLEPSSADFRSKVDAIFAALSMDPSAPMLGKHEFIGISNKDHSEPADSSVESEEDQSSIFATWWFWTAAGVLVVGAGLTAGLLLIDSSESNSAQVVFRF